MTYFKLDIPRLNDLVIKYKNSRKNCVEDLDYIYKGFGYLDSAWNDSNSFIFRDKIRKDRCFLNDYFDYLEEISNEINRFKSNIVNICYENGYKSKSIVIKFDDSEIANCKKYLNNSIEILNDCLNKINVNAFDLNFEYIDLIYELRKEIKAIKSYINKLNSDISSFVCSINREIEDSRIRINKISKPSFKLKPLDYRWKTTNINAKKLSLKKIKQYSTRAISTINYKAQDLNIDFQDNISNSNVSIDLKKTNKVSGLNNNVNNVIYNSNDINLKENNKIEGLHDNVTDISGRNNNIDLENSKRIENLNNNITPNFSNSKNIEFKINTDKTIDRLNSFNASNNEIGNFINKDNNLINNIEKSKVNEPTINSEIIFDDITVSSGISTSEVNDAKINNINVK